MLTPAATKPATLGHYEALVVAALRRVADGLDEALDLDALAAPACMAPLHFHRVFRGLVGETPLQLHRRLRLERAAWQLAAQRDATVLRIALEAGYETHESFTRAFAAAFGRTPVEHRAFSFAIAAAASPALRRGSSTDSDTATPGPARFHHLQAACGLHAGGLRVEWPDDPSTLLIHRGALVMDVELETCTQRRVAALSHRGPYNTIGAAFDRLGGLAGPAGLFAHPGALTVGIYYDDPATVPAAQLRSDAGVIVPQGVTLPSGLHEVLLPAGRWARTLHRGSYAGLGDAWQRLLGQWLPHSGHRMKSSGECFELYLNHPGNARDDELQTLLYAPLEG
jgi:AraC family transcriptional regulator